MSNEIKEVIEFSEQQIARIDQVMQITVDYLAALINRPLTEEETTALWDSSVSGEIANVASELLLRHNMHTHYPARIWDDNGDHVVLIENYYGKGA